MERSSGQIRIDLGEATSVDADDNAANTDFDSIEIDTATHTSDMLVHVKQCEPGDEQRFKCTVVTELEKRTCTWTLGKRTEDIVQGFMEQFIKAPKSDRRFELRGAGIRLFDAAPGIFKEALQLLVEKGRTPRTILVVSDEPYIPWELMNPGKAVPDWDAPLGVVCTISRWVRRSGSPAQSVPLVNSYIIAPAYESADYQLSKSREEVDLVKDAFQGEEANPLTLRAIDARLSSQPFSLIHFVCHGKQSTGVEQVLLLHDDRELSTTGLRGSPGIQQAMEEVKTLVFLNACEVGRPAITLTGTGGGFAATFIELGAAAVIAPLWSVEDRIAHKVAAEFYRRVQEKPETPFAEIFRDLRARSFDENTRDTEDTWAAYCFYGDPLASACS